MSGKYKIPIVAICVVLLAGVGFWRYQEYAKAEECKKEARKASVIELFLVDDVTQTEVNKLRKGIDSLDDVKDTTFESKKQALEKYKNQKHNKERREQLDRLATDENPLPASLSIRLQDPSDENQQKRLKSLLEKSQNGIIESAQWPQQYDVVYKYCRDKTGFLRDVIDSKGAALNQSSEMNFDPNPRQPVSTVSPVASFSACPNKDIPRVSLRKPPANGFVNRTPTIEGTAPYPNSVVSVSIDGIEYMFPSERKNLTINENFHPRTDRAGRFSFPIDLYGDRVIGPGDAGIPPDPRGVDLGPHRFQVSTGSTQGVGTESAALSCVVTATLR